MENKHIVFGSIISLIFGLTLTSCGSGSDVALLSDISKSGYKDNGFCEVSYNSLYDYCKNKNLSYKYYQISVSNDTEYDRITLNSIKAGTRVIVGLGYNFEKSFIKYARRYQGIRFVLLDSSVTGSSNLTSITFNEAEAGYLAGYALVKEGLKNIGYMGGVSCDAVNRYGLGFLLGINDAASEKINVFYTHTGTFSANENIKFEAKDWYYDGIENIFSCGGGIFSSILEACEFFKGKTVTGVDVNQNVISDLVLTSATKNIKVALTKTLDHYFNNEKMETSYYYTIADDGLEIPTDPWRFNNFTIEQYKAVYKKIKDKEVVVDVNPDDAYSGDTTKIFASSLANINFTYRYLLY
jgi:basic membrane protein A